MHQLAAKPGASGILNVPRRAEAGIKKAPRISNNAESPTVTSVVASVLNIDANRKSDNTLCVSAAQLQQGSRKTGQIRCTKCLNGQPV